MESIFLNPSMGNYGGELGPSIPLFTRGAGLQVSDETRAALANLQRGEITGDVQQVLMHLGQTMAQFDRAITSGQTAFPVRENLEAEAKLLMPLDTPIRNMIPRVPGAGKAAAWKQATALGPGASNRGISTRAFFAEGGAPLEENTVYADKSAAYKLLGKMGGVTGFAMAAGANFQNQLAVERTMKMRQVMQNEENALLNGNSASTAAPWGDGVSALAFDGINTLTATANGTPAGQIQTAVGALTTAHIDLQLSALWNQGGRDLFMIMNEQETRSLAHLAEASGSIIRVQATSDGQAVLGVRIVGYVHPVTGEVVKVIPSRDQPAGTITYGAMTMPNGEPTLKVDVLPQVQLPQLAPNENVQGYVAQEIAPSAADPQTYRFIISVFEVLKMYSALHFAKSTGVTAV